MKTNNSQQSFPSRFKLQFKTVSTSYTVQVVSNDSLHVPIKRTHNCSSNLGCLVTWCIWQIKPTFPNRQTQLTLLSTHNLNTKFHCASSAMTVPISLSQHSSTYTARQTPMLQAPISRLPVSANIRQAPLLLHTTDPQVFNYSRTTLQMWQLNQGHWTKQTRPSVVLMPTFLQFMATKPGHRPFRVLMPTFLQFMATKPGLRPFRVLMPTFLQFMATKPGHRPFRVLMPIFLNSVATKPRLLIIPGSHADLSQFCGN